jgi:nucleoid-associated protein YgaU
MTLTAATLLAGAKTPEQQTLEVARVLKPLSDDRWQEIAKEQLGQQYEVTRGDTLWGISQRLFGEGNYWPKIWALNGQSIPNPHWIYPGAKLVFMPGSATSLPSLRLADASGAAGAESASTTDVPRSQQWRDLPLQGWEQVQVTLPPEVDAQGFDLRNRYQIPKIEGFDIHRVAQSEELPVLGRIRAAESRSAQLVQGDTVFLVPESEGSLQPGQILTLSRKPDPLTGPGVDRTGRVYRLEGRIRVVGETNGTWLGRIISSTDGAERENSILIDLTMRSRLIAPVAAAEALEATLINDRTTAVSVMAQHQLAFINRGSDDGVVPGMVFRAYQYRDPRSETPLSSENVSSLGDCSVIDVTPQFSTVLVTSSIEVIPDGTKVIALTDISGLTGKSGARIQEIDGKGSGKPANELDGLEEDDGLSDEERRNLKQLERKQETPAPNLEETPTAPAPEETPPETAPEEELAPVPESTEPLQEPEQAPEPETESDPSEPVSEPEAPPDF